MSTQQLFSVCKAIIGEEVIKVFISTTKTCDIMLFFQFK